MYFGTCRSDQVHNIWTSETSDHKTVTICRWECSRNLRHYEWQGSRNVRSLLKTLCRRSISSILLIAGPIQHWQIVERDAIMQEQLWRRWALTTGQIKAASGYRPDHMLSLYSEVVTFWAISGCCRKVYWVIIFFLSQVYKSILKIVLAKAIWIKSNWREERIILKQIDKIRIGEKGKVLVRKIGPN